MQTPGSSHTSPGLSQLSADQRATLIIAIDTIIPADGGTAGWAGGVQMLLEQHGDGFMAWAIPHLRDAVDTLDAASIAAHGTPFAALNADRRHEVILDQLRAEPAETPTSPFDAPERHPIRALMTVAHEGFYGGTAEPAGWAVAGFNPVPGGVVPADPEPERGIDSASVLNSYDVIIVGAGGGGAVVAAELAAGGQRVLLLERARPHRDSELRGNHLQGKRLELYDVTAGPGAGNPRVFEHADGSSELLDGEGNGTRWGLTAMTQGGGTRLWQGMAWRFYEQDFAMASTYGVPEESTLVDWPFPLAELNPFYDRVEWELGVSGDSNGSFARRTQQNRPYPMPPIRDAVAGPAYAAAAHALGWEPSPVPFAINSVPRDGRPACVNCPQCVGHACPVNAKNGTHNTFLPRAIASGNCDLVTSAQVVRILHDERGTATGVRVIISQNGQAQAREIKTRRVIVAAGAIESARLLLSSGIGNEWVGRNHHTHGVAVALAAQGPDVNPYFGPGHSVAVVDHLHANGAPWGGGVMFDLSPPFPLAKAVDGIRLAREPIGSAHKEWMRVAPNSIGAMSMVQEVPHQLSRVSLDPDVKDRWGMPVARLRGQSHRGTVEATTYMGARCAEWLDELGAAGVFRMQIPGGVRGAEHSAGTARMGNDPAASACDPAGRIHGMRNVYVADASLHPTNGGVNPGLTVMANAMRVASLVLNE